MWQIFAFVGSSLSPATILGNQIIAAQERWLLVRVMQGFHVAIKHGELCYIGGKTQIAHLKYVATYSDVICQRNKLVRFVEV